ncbi:cbb3-type cytochrome oxidase assembly protein CcoS [Flagellimonas meridianipacifica]|uniref:Cbb3-type cytochrome oxidase maturation protein n=1 Tax=Flagellimonas meridianipacifica TaxID=1080225 RepID=A0A2T0MJ50_9FLAO|nr:cbb3-type cytochrome oxidase assembly protein CcoS [Allomuricauda pacifica]PRX57620.1 cbb3-type cytochrome oxidase maturation protein [Allomuricauda pacifica]
MSVIYVLLAISICVALVFFLAFIRSVKAGQYDDSYTPSVRMLFEDELVQNEDDVQLKKSKKTNQIKDTNQ